MKVRRALVALALLLGATATGCSLQPDPRASEAAVQSASANVEPFVGGWLIDTEAFPNGSTYTRAELEAADALITLDVRDDGTFTMSDGDRRTDDTWEPTSDTTATFWADDTPANVTVDDDRLTLMIADGPIMVFDRW